MFWPQRKGIISPIQFKLMYLFLLNSWLIFWHPFFVSVTEINHNPAEKTLEISIRTFTDDLENAIRLQNPGKKVDLMNPPAGGTMDSLVKKYIVPKMSLVVNGQPRELNYVGFERVEESIWTYFEVSGIDVLKNLNIHDAILYEYKKEQINMVHVITGQNRQSRKLDNPEADWEFKF